MKITDDDELFAEIAAARVLLRSVNNDMLNITGSYDDHGWFIPKETEIIQWSFCEWVEIIRAIFDKLDGTYTYLEEKLCPSIKKAPVSPTKETTDANNTTENGCQPQHTTKTGKAQGVAG